MSSNIIPIRNIYKKIYIKKSSRLFILRPKGHPCR